MRLKRAVKRQPPHAAAFHALGHVLSSMQRYDEATETLRHGLEIAPMMPEMSVQLGYALLQRKNHAEAKAAFARALAISPTSADALFGIAKAHQEACEYAPAVDYLRRGLMSRPDDDNGLAPSRTLSAGARPARRRLRVLPRRSARRCKTLRRSAHPRWRPRVAAGLG